MKEQRGVGVYFCPLSFMLYVGLSVGCHLLANKRIHSGLLFACQWRLFGREKKSGDPATEAVALVWCADAADKLLLLLLLRWCRCRDSEHQSINALSVRQRWVHNRSVQYTRASRSEWRLVCPPGSGGSRGQGGHAPPFKILAPLCLPIWTPTH